MLTANTEVTLFGVNEYTKPLMSLFTVRGIIDETSNEKAIFGVPNCNLKNTDPTTPIINCVNNSRAYFAQQKLISCGFSQVLFIGEIVAYYPKLFDGTPLALAMHAMQQDKDKLMHLMSIFDDDESREHFQRILDFRETLQIKHLDAFEVKIDEQYFERFLEKEKFEYLIDGGAYDGADSKRFAELFPHYKKIYIIEPSKKNSTLIPKTMGDCENYQIINACIGSAPGKTGFSGEGTAARPDMSEESVVDVITLSSLKTPGRTLVKLDIEGAEVDALIGARDLIENEIYSFAISAYHLPHDLTDLINLLIHTKVRRKYYFRHYSNGYAESVFFAI